VGTWGLEVCAFTMSYSLSSTIGVISNVDDDLLISLAVTCYQHRSSVGPVIHTVLRPSKGWQH